MLFPVLCWPLENAHGNSVYWQKENSGSMGPGKARGRLKAYARGPNVKTWERGAHVNREMGEEKYTFTVSTSRMP